MDESTSNHTHPPSRQQAAVGGSRASSKATHAPSAKLWKQVNVHRTLRPLHGPPRARSLHSTSLPYCGYVGGPGGPACTVSGCRELPSRLAGSWGPSDSAMRFSSPGVLPSSGASTSQQWRQPMPMTCERNLCPTGEGRDGTGPSSRYEGRVFSALTSLCPRKAVGYDQSWVCASWCSRCSCRTASSDASVPKFGLQHWPEDPYFHVSILPCHRPFLRFAFEGRAYQYRSCPSGCPYRPVSSRK